MSEYVLRFRREKETVLTAKPSKITEFTLDGLSFDVRESGSIAPNFGNGAIKRGVYRLVFSNGERYVGQADDVVKRFASHHRKYRDIERIEYFPSSHGSLNDIEQLLVTLSEKEYPLRNIMLTNKPAGRGDYSITLEEGRSIDLPWDRDRRTRAAGLSGSSSIEKFQRLTSTPIHTYDILRAVLGWYVAETISAPELSVKQLWISSCLPSTNRRPDFYRTASISCGNIETLVCMVERLEDGDWAAPAFINTSPIENAESLEGNGNEFRTQVSSYREKSVLTWHFDLDTLFAISQGTYEFPHTALLLDAAYDLNVRMMRRGSTMYSRFHSSELGDEVLRTARGRTPAM